MKIATIRSTNIALAFAALFALAFALTLQYAFGVAPCTMCMWERWPYVAVILLVAMTLLTGHERLTLAIVVLLMLGNAVLSAYHVGVEEGIFALPDTCNSDIKATTIEELRAQLATVRPTCDQAALRLFGISLAGWNGLYAAALAVFGSYSLILAWRHANRQR